MGFRATNPSPAKETRNQIEMAMAVLADLEHSMARMEQFNRELLDRLEESERDCALLRVALRQSNEPREQ